jgi:uncharacterized membrane protein
VNNLKLILLIPYLLGGVVLICLSVPLIRGRIAPNGWYGFRVRRTLESPAVWYPANRYAAYHLLVLGLILIPFTATLYILPQIDFLHYALANLTLVLVGLGVGMIRSFRYLSRLN